VDIVVRHYQDLDAWKLANDVKQRVYALVTLANIERDVDFIRQIRKSASSAPANLSEGFGYYRHPEFARHVRIAKASLMETQNHLLDGADRGYWTRESGEPLAALANRAIGACVRLLKYLERTDAPNTESPGRRTGTTFPKRER
jgi:four helix bundle protein